MNLLKLILACICLLCVVTLTQAQKVFVTKYKADANWAIWYTK